MRTYEYINSGWRFSKVGGLPEGRQTEPKSDDNGWELVELPHTWNAADCTGVSGRASEYSEGYYRGAGCYRGDRKSTRLNSSHPSSSRMPSSA